MKKTSQVSRPTLGFLTANLNLGASRVLWPGLLDAAVKGNANLISFPGGRLKSSDGFESQRNIIFDLVNPTYLDGLISWTSALGGTGAVTPEEMRQFHLRYIDLPAVNLAAPVEFGPLVSIDSYRGMQSLVSHLVDVHGYCKIALIRGPEGHPYALERYKAFMDILHEKGLSPDPALISPMMNWEKGAEAMRILLDERLLEPGRDFQAIIAASDLLAIDALRVLVDRGIRVPADVAIAGFNNIEEGRLVRPPLTSVSLPFYEQGQNAVEMLLTRLAGEDIPDKVILDSRILIRQSCGCSSQSIDLATAGYHPEKPEKLQTLRQTAQEQVVEQITRVISNRGIAATWAKLLIDTFLAEINGKSPGQFLSALDSMLKQGKLDGDETAAWQTAISVLRRNMLAVFTPELQTRAEDLYGQARVVIGEAIQHAQSIRQVELERQNGLLRALGQALITTFDMEKLSDVLVDRLPNLGIHSCYLVLYENPEQSLEWSRLILANTNNTRTSFDPAGLRFPSHQLVPPGLMPKHRYSLVVEPLYFQNEPLGYAVFEVGPRDGDVYEVLRGHISSAIKGALLFQEADEARWVAERANQIKTRLLANVSHELRTPLNIIIGHSQRILDAPPPDLAEDIEDIQHSAEHQLRIINDLLDLSRAEINALDLYPEMLDPRPLIEDAFAIFSKDAVSGGVRWWLDMPAQIPMIFADPLRLKQILLNLLSNAAKFTLQGEITLGVELVPPHLHIWVSDSGTGIPPETIDRIYEPFYTHNQSAGGIGLGLSITKHLINLHHGFLEVESQPGVGSTFHIYLPLPDLDSQTILPAPSGEAVLWLISNAEEIPSAIDQFSKSRGLTLQQKKPGPEIEGLFAMGLPSVVAWDMVGTNPEDWGMIRRLHNHPKMAEIPFILFQGNDDDNAIGFTSVVVKPASNQALWDSLRPTIIPARDGSVLIIDDDPRARQTTYEVVKKGLPHYAIHTAEDGVSGLDAMLANPPSLVILDLMMPNMNGFEVLDRMRSDEALRRIPVVILSNRRLTLADVKRLEQHANVILQNKGILSDDEMIASLQYSLFPSDTLHPQTSALVKKAIAYLHQNYHRQISRLNIADEIGVNEDYLTRVFKQELGISPWDYLNRYRIYQAKELLRKTHQSVSQIAEQIGFSDQAYFSRVFRKITEMSPSAYRDQAQL